MPDSDRNMHVSLGCGTLLIIALIVLIFSKQGNNQLDQEVGHLRNEIGQLKQAMEGQTNQIKILQEKVDKLADHGAKKEK
jgi:Sec-independent protein translocase protein TatA